MGGYKQLVDSLRDLAAWTDKDFRSALRTELRGPNRDRHIGYLLAKWNTKRRLELMEWLASERQR